MLLEDALDRAKVVQILGRKRNSEIWRDLADYSNWLLADSGRGESRQPKRGSSSWRLLTNIGLGCDSNGIFGIHLGLCSEKHDGPRA